MHNFQPVFSFFHAVYYNQPFSNWFIVYFIIFIVIQWHANAIVCNCFSPIWWKYVFRNNLNWIVVIIHIELPMPAYFLSWSLNSIVLGLYFCAFSKQKLLELWAFKSTIFNKTNKSITKVILAGYSIALEYRQVFHSLIFISNGEMPCFKPKINQMPYLLEFGRIDRGNIWILLMPEATVTFHFNIWFFKQ